MLQWSAVGIIILLGRRTSPQSVVANMTSHMTWGRGHYFIPSGSLTSDLLELAGFFFFWKMLTLHPEHWIQNTVAVMNDSLLQWCSLSRTYHNHRESLLKQMAGLTLTVSDALSLTWGQEFPLLNRFLGDTAWRPLKTTTLTFPGCLGSGVISFQKVLVEGWRSSKSSHMLHVLVLGVVIYII